MGGSCVAISCAVCGLVPYEMCLLGLAATCARPQRCLASLEESNVYRTKKSRAQSRQQQASPDFKMQILTVLQAPTGWSMNVG